MPWGGRHVVLRGRVECATLRANAPGLSPRLRRAGARGGDVVPPTAGSSSGKGDFLKLLMALTVLGWLG